LLTKLNKLSADATSAGDVAQYNAIQVAIQSVSSLKIYADPQWWDNLSVSFSKVCGQVKSGERLSDDDFSLLTTFYQNLYEAQGAFQSAYTDLSTLYVTYFPGQGATAE
jgi:hypothetical protein